MKNIEKYLNELCAVADANNKIGSVHLHAIGRDVVSGKLNRCADMDCDRCEFGLGFEPFDHCSSMFSAWLFDECDENKVAKK